MPVILDALKVPSQDLVTRIKNDPDLEARITKAMAERRALGKEDDKGGAEVVEIGRVEDCLIGCGKA